MKPRHLVLSSLALLVVGCSLPSAPGDTGPRNQLEAASQAVEPLAGISFQPLSADNARYASAGGPMPMSAPAAAPMAAAPSPSMLGGPVSGNMHGGMPYGYGYGGGGPHNVPMALVSMTEGTAPGSRGPLNRVLADVVAPVLKDWAADAHLVSSNATLGNDGLGLDAPTPNPHPVPGKMMPYGDPGQAGWRLHYVSPSRHETLQFMVGADKTLVIRMRWAPVDLDAAPVTVDSDVAVQKLVAAIEDASFRSAEEESGVDYFLGTPFNVPGGPGVPMPMPMPTGYDPGRIEAVYDVPDNARWNANLQTVLGKTVWDLSFFAPSEPVPMPMPSVVPVTFEDGQKPAPMPSPMQPPEYYFENHARGMVDAQTGAVIRFTRPIKRYMPRPPVPAPSVAPSAPPPPPPMKPVPTPTPSN